MGDMADYYREQEDYLELYEFSQHDPSENDYKLMSRKQNMTPKITKTKTTNRTKKPILIAVGKHFINPSDIRCITQVRKDLYVVKFFSDPNPQYACWISKDDIGVLLNHFEIIVSEEE